MDPKVLSIEDFDYALPESRIAFYPLSERDASKLLIWRSGDISESTFSGLDELLGSDTLLVLNNTKVIRARLFFENPQGARIEVFCLDPLEPTSPERALGQRRSCLWKCYVGNLKRWKAPSIVCHLNIDTQSVTLRAERVSSCDDAHSIRLFWDSDHTMAEIFDAAGHIPLPPYIKRADEAEDQERYQAIFADRKGSVAAPTASLHFSPPLLSRLANKGVDSCTLTLHVGAGTFKPVHSSTMGEHHMHQERLIVQRSSLETLVTAVGQGRRIIPVGTTALRSLESLYYLGLRLSKGMDIFEIPIGQWEPYEVNDKLSPMEALKTLMDYMDRLSIDRIETSTGIFIAPGFKFHFAQGLITNFHQPKSTLLVLIASLMGDSWRDFYQYALDHEFRFLSYGDACLLLP